MNKEEIQEHNKDVRLAKNYFNAVFEEAITKIHHRAQMAKINGQPYIMIHSKVAESIIDDIKYKMERDFLPREYKHGE